MFRSIMSILMNNLSKRTYSPASKLDKLNALLHEQSFGDHKGGDLACDNSLGMGGHTGWNGRKWKECRGGT